MDFMWGYWDPVIEKQKKEYQATKEISRAYRGSKNKDS